MMKRSGQEAKVPPVHVLVMAKRLQLAARVSRGAPPALFALLQRDRSPWKRQVLVDLCRLRDIMRDELSAMPPTPVEPDAWERLWKDHPRSWKQLLRVFVQKVARGAEGGSFSAHPSTGVSVCSNPDMEFLCPNCPAYARTWPNREALRSHVMWDLGWRNPVCCTHVVGSHEPESVAPSSFTSSWCGALQAGNSGGSRALPKTGTCGAGEGEPTGSARAQKGIINMVTLGWRPFCRLYEASLKTEY